MNEKEMEALAGGCYLVGKGEMWTLVAALAASLVATSWLMFALLSTTEKLVQCVGA